MGIFSGKCIASQFFFYANIIEYIYKILDGIAYYTPNVYGIDYCS